MRAGLDNARAVEHDDEIGHADRAETVRDEDSDTPFDGGDSLPPRAEIKLRRSIPASSIAPACGSPAISASS